MEKTPNKYAFLIRLVCYILIPIAMLSILQSLVSLWYYVEEDIQVKAGNFFESSQFADLYKESIYNNVEASYSKVAASPYLEENDYDEYTMNITNQYDIIESNAQGEKIYYKTYLQNKNLKFLIIDNEKHTAITNVNQTLNTDTIEKIKKELNGYTYFWSYERGKVNTNISLLSLENIIYQSPYTDIQEYNCIIYTGMKAPLQYHDYYYNYEILYDHFLQPFEYAIFNLFFGLFMILVCIILITIFAGRKKGKQEIDIDALDKIPYEFVLIFFFCMIGIGIPLLGNAYTSIYYINITSILIFIVGSMILYVVGMLFYLTSVKRIKTHTLWKNTVIYRFYQLIEKAVNSVSQNLSLSLELGIIIIGYTILLLFCFFLLSNAGPGVLPFLLGLWGIMFYWGFYYLKKLKQMKEMIKELYEGNTQIRLNENEYTGELKQLCIYLNDIAGGFQNAINKSLKSERMKTELITNVSHDIKTPLTSIINYVDLLKKEKMPNKKATEYLEILDQKSQRLKRLTEDLVEASKASSGNIKLNMEKLDVKELIQQVSGEFQDRLKEKKLELILNLPEEEAMITADSRYLYRVMENMYSNIVKYALPKSRVYVDVTLQKEIVEINLKNISKEKLNITAEELMERFVRGESSRNTEGSGLGLSIAQSLTELQKGTFQIYLDGDLFKVIIQFKREQ